MAISAIWRVATILSSGSVATLSVLVPGQAIAQTLEEALVSAYGNNASLQAGRAALRATDEDVPQALANWRPTVSIAGSKGLQWSNQNFSSFGGTTATTTNSTSNQVTETRPSSVSLSVSQPIYRGGRTDAQTSQAENLVKAGRAGLVATEQTVLLNSVTDYMNVVEQQAVLDLDLNNEQVLRRQLESTQNQFQVGEVTRTDVAEAEAAYAAAVSTRQAAEGQLEVYRAAYTHDIGQAPGKLTAPMTKLELPPSRDEAIRLSLNSAPTVVQAQYTLAAAEDNVRLIRGNLLPTISVDGSAQRTTGQTTEFSTNPGYTESITANLNVPLYEGGLVYSQTRAAIQTATQDRHNLDDAQQAASQAASQAWDHLVATRATIVSLERQVQANQIALEGVRAEQSVGSRTIIDVLNQEQTLVQSRVNLVQSQHDEIIYEFTLAQSVGRLTAKDLGLPIDYYDPEKHYDSVKDKWLGFGSEE